jgi:MFS family permease
VIQAVVEPDMQARIITLLSSIGGSKAPIGLIIAGPVADHTRIKTWFFLGGILCVLMSVAGLFIPAVMNIENHQSQTLAKVEVEAWEVPIASVANNTQEGDYPISQRWVSQLGPTC